MNGKNDHGFTLVELMVAMAITLIVGVVITVAYTVQSRVHAEQDALVETQQNIRAALQFMQSELRLAGYNPQGTEGKDCGASAGRSVKPGIHTATANSIGFSMDLDNDGKCTTPGENVLYQLYGLSNGVMKLGRRELGSTQQPVAENISADTGGGIAGLEFTYLFAPSRLGETGSTPPTSAPKAGELESIRAVQISLIVRSETPDKQSRAAAVFDIVRPDAWGGVDSSSLRRVTYNDSYRYRHQGLLVNLRNMGLE